MANWSELVVQGINSRARLTKRRAGLLCVADGSRAADAVAGTCMAGGAASFATADAAAGTCMAGGAASFATATPTSASAPGDGAVFSVTVVPASCPAPGKPLRWRHMPQASIPPPMIELMITIPATLLERGLCRGLLSRTTRSISRMGSAIVHDRGASRPR